MNKTNVANEMSAVSFVNGVSCEIALKLAEQLSLREGLVQIQRNKSNERNEIAKQSNVVNEANVSRFMSQI